MRRPLILAALLLLSTPAFAQFTPGQRVNASPTQLAAKQYWQPCVVRSSAPNANGYWQLNCAIDLEKNESLMWTPARFIEPMPGPPVPQTAQAPTGPRREPYTTNPPAPPPPPASTAAAWRPGATVLGSPTQMQSSWQRCQIKSGPDANGYYLADCADEYMGTEGRLLKTVRESRLNRRWVRNDDPRHRPDLTLASARADEQRRAQAQVQRTRDNERRRAELNRPPPPELLRAVAIGRYECWAYSSARMGLNFAVTGPGAYRHADGAGRFRMDPGSREVFFESGPLRGMMPAGFRALYVVRGQRPTLSYVGRGGSEVSFCERV